MKKSPEWLDRNEYPFRSRFISVNGVQMHYTDEGEGEKTIVFLHGTPSWSFEYRKLISGLSKTCRCIAPDMIGFGLSDKPAHYNYSPQRHAKNLELFITLLDLKNIILVLHDFGGPIGLHYAIKKQQSIEKIILLNTWAWDPKDDVNAWVLRSNFLGFLYKQFNFSPRFLLPASFGSKKIARSVLKNYIKPFQKKSERNAPLALARSLATEGKWFDEIWSTLPLIRNIPAVFIWGMQDRLINPVYLQKLRTVFTDHKLYRLDSCGHFPQEEEPDKLIAFISASMRETKHSF